MEENNDSDVLLDCASRKGQVEVPEGLRVYLAIIPAIQLRRSFEEPALTRGLSGGTRAPC